MIPPLPPAQATVSLLTHRNACARLMPVGRNVRLGCDNDNRNRYAGDEHCKGAEDENSNHIERRVVIHFFRPPNSTRITPTTRRIAKPESGATFDGGGVFAVANMTVTGSPCQKLGHRRSR